MSLPSAYQHWLQRKVFCKAQGPFSQGTIERKLKIIVSSWILTNARTIGLLLPFFFFFANLRRHSEVRPVLSLQNNLLFPSVWIFYNVQYFIFI